ncbi:MAG: hypothetical protein FWG90_00960 [Oscillospiraceae bacterium]|nr:hypothetical protein [Oscillospiraceae bacterium]
MKKLLSATLAILLICIFPISAATAESPALKPPVLQYRLINHDKIALRWSRVEGADRYFIYQLNPETGKYAKKHETQSTSITLTNLEAETEYSYFVAAVREVGGKANLGRASNKVDFITPFEWYYCRHESDDEVYPCVAHYDDTGHRQIGDFYSLVYDEKFQDYLYQGLMSRSVTSAVSYFGEWLYYVDVPYSELEWASPASRSFFRVKADGTQESQVSMDSGSTIFFNDEIYMAVSRYYHETDIFYESALYKFSLDGENRYELYNSGSYFDDKIYHMSKYITGLAVNDSGIYYLECTELPPGDTETPFKYDLFHMNHDGENLNRLFAIDDLGSNERLYGFFIDGDYAYYGINIIDTKYNDVISCTMYKVSLKDGEGKKKIFSDDSDDKMRIQNVELDNGYFYFQGFHFNPDGKGGTTMYYRIKANGTGLTEQETPFVWRF